MYMKGFDALGRVAAYTISIDLFRAVHSTNLSEKWFSDVYYYKNGSVMYIITQLTTHQKIKSESIFPFSLFLLVAVWFLIFKREENNIKF